MFDNIGERIQSFARVFLWLGVAICGLVGFVLFVNGVSEDGTGVMIFGLLLMTVGSLVSWVNFLLLYGFGQLIVNSDRIARNISRIARNIKE